MTLTQSLHVPTSQLYGPYVCPHSALWLVSDHNLTIKNNNLINMNILY